MSKNLTRKGLALGAVVALGSSLFAGTPAFATGELTLAPKAGTLLKTIEGEKFELTAGIAPGTSSANIAYLKYEVVSTSSFTVGTTGGSTNTASETADAAIGVTAAANTLVFDPTTTPAAATYQSIELTSGAVAAGTPVTATVTAFFDTNNDNNLTSGEYTSAPVTVTWVDLADITPTVAFDAPTAGVTALDAYLTLPGINTAQIPAAHVAVQVSNNLFGTPGATDATGAPIVVAGGTLQTDGTFKFAATGISGVAANEVVSVQATYLNGTATGFVKAVTAKDGATSSVTAQVLDSVAGAVVGAPVYAHATAPVSLSTTIASINSGTKTITLAAAKSIADNDIVWLGTDVALGAKVAKAAVAQTVNSISIEAVAKSGVKTTTKGVKDVATSANDADGVAVVRSDITTFEVVATLKDANGKALAGVDVTANVTSGNLATDASDGVTVNTKPVDSDTAAAVSGLKTDANGQVKLSFAATAADATDNVIVNIASQNITTAGSTDGQTTITWTAASYTAYALNSNGNVSTTTDGTAVSIPVSVVDQWGDAPAAGYDVIASFDTTVGDGYVAQATTASTAATETKAALVNGKATLTITDNGTGVGVNVYDITVQKLLGNTYQTSIATISNYLVQIQSADSLVAGTIAITSGTGSENSTSKVWEVTTAEPLALVDAANYDARTQAGTAPTGHATNSVVDLSGTVSTAGISPAVIDGAKVVVKGAGLQLKGTISGANVWAKDEITLYTNASGAFTLNVYSNKAGKQTLTITSGAVTRTVTVVFEEAAATAGTSLVVNSVSKIISGSTLVVTGLLTDKYGNPVNTANGGAGTGAFELTYDGPGLPVPTTLPVDTDSKGKFSFRVILGNNENGVATITASYGGTDAIGTGTNDIIVEKTVLVGISASVSAGSKKANVVVKNAAGLTVKVVSGSKSTTKVATSNSYKVSLSKLTSGSKTVKVYVNDILVTSKKVTVRR